MINQKRFLNTLQESGVRFFTGVPDSFLNGFCNYLLEIIPEDRHVIAYTHNSEYLPKLRAASRQPWLSILSNPVR